MGLLDDLPYGLLNQIRNAAQNQIPNAYSGAGDVNDLPSWVARQPQRAPLSFAGPDLSADIAASSSSLPRAGVPLPQAQQPATDLSWLPANRSVDSLRAQRPTPPAQNLTSQALRMKGVPEADIAAATGNPEMLRQLIMKNYGPSSALAPVRTGYTPLVSGASGGPFADTRGTAALDDDATLDSLPVWRGLNPANRIIPTRPMDKQVDSHHEQCIAKCTDLALPTGDFGIQHQRCVQACLSGGKSGFPRWDGFFPHNLNSWE
jgi:hypothetical protein